jgi:ATP-dependent Lon protease
MSWLVSQAKECGIDEGSFAKSDIHLHIPTACTPFSLTKSQK